MKILPYPKPLLTKLLCFIIIVSLTLSCAVFQRFYVPGEELSPANDAYYWLENLDPDYIPQAVNANIIRIEQGNPLLNEVQVEDASLASSQTDNNGTVAFEDNRLNIVLPVVILDKKNQPVTGVTVDYVSVGDTILLTVSDPDGRYEPISIATSLEELTSATQSNTQGQVGLASPARLVITVAVVIKIIAVAVGVVLTARAVVKLAINPPQLIRTLGQPDQICVTPEQMGDAASATFGIILSAVSIAQFASVTIGEAVFVGARDAIITEVILGEGIATSLQEPILWQYYSPSGAVVNRLLASNHFDSDDFSGFWLPIGHCTEVPNIVGMPQADAEALLRNNSLEFYTSLASEEGLYPAGYVEAQEPNPTGSSPLFGNEVIMMLPENPVSDEGRVHLIISIGQRAFELPDLVGLTPGQAEELLGPSFGLVLIASEPCLNVDAGEISAQFPAPGTIIEPGDSVEIIECTGAPSSGDVQFTLTWHTTADLDLFVTDPDDYEIYYNSPYSPSGGTLDVDANGYCANVTTSPVENIFWDFGDAPSGRYKVEVAYSLTCEDSYPVDWHLIVLIDGESFEYSGTLYPQEHITVDSFYR